MKNNNIILAHGLNDKIIKYFLNNFNNKIITFDDGLASLYKYKKELKELSKNNKIIIFVNPFMVYQSEKFNIDINFIECFKAHEKAKKYNFENYLNQKMITDLSNFCEIGLHSWDHFLYFKKRKLRDRIIFYKKDIENSYNFIKKFIKNKLSFAWPYNKEILEYKALQNRFYEKLNIKVKYYGKERLSGWWNYYELS